MLSHIAGLASVTAVSDLASGAERSQASPITAVLIGIVGIPVAYLNWRYGRRYNEWVESIFRKGPPGEHPRIYDFAMREGSTAFILCASIIALVSGVIRLA